MSMPRVRSWNVALAAAGAVALIVEGQVRAKGGLSAGDYVLAVAAAVPLAWGTRVPLLALAGVAAGAILCDAAFDAGWAATGLVAVQLFTVALRDLRATLGLLRDRGEVAPTAPVFDLEALPGLVENARASGVHADIDVEVDHATVPSAVGGAAFRIIQEALTNVLRHAEASSASVRVRARSNALEIEISDDGRANGVGVTPGHGLRGMAERAAALGGRVDAGPLDAGASGFLLKGGELADLVHAIRVIADGESLLAPSVTRRLIDTYVARPRRPPETEHEGLDELTAREREVLSLIAEGLTNAEIAQVLQLS